MRKSNKVTRGNMKGNSKNPLKSMVLSKCYFVTLILQVSGGWNFLFVLSRVFFCGADMYFYGYRGNKVTFAL